MSWIPHASQHRSAMSSQRQPSSRARTGSTTTRGSAPRSQAAYSVPPSWSASQAAPHAAYPSIRPKTLSQLTQSLSMLRPPSTSQPPTQARGQSQYADRADTRPPMSQPPPPPSDAACGGAVGAGSVSDTVFRSMVEVQRDLRHVRDAFDSRDRERLQEIASLRALLSETMGRVTLLEERATKMHRAEAPASSILAASGPVRPQPVRPLYHAIGTPFSAPPAAAGAAFAATKLLLTATPMPPAKRFDEPVAVDAGDSDGEDLLGAAWS